MTSNDKGSLRVGFDPAIDNQYPLSIYIVDNRNYHASIYVRRDDIEPLLACLWLPMYLMVRLVTMTGDYVVKWFSHHEIAFMDSKCITGTHLPTVLQSEEAMELVRLVRYEMDRNSAVSESDPLDGANKRRDENLRGVFA